MARVHQRVFAARFGRYTAGSIVAFAASELTLVLCFGTGVMSAASASVAAFFAGAVPNYLLNRSWVWQRTERGETHRELVPYIAVSLATLGLAALATSVASRLAPAGDAARTAFVAVAYLATYVVLFVAKFFAYQRFVFRPRALAKVVQGP